ncbi:diguanylate cyclase domain-containing protein [Methylobacterium sp. JK268]
MVASLMCLGEQHAGWILLVAGLVAWTSAAIALRMLDHADRARTGRNLPWLLAAGFCAGAGIWSTHFIALLGYDPSLDAAYALVPMLASMAAAIGGSLMAFAVLEASDRLLAAVAGGGLFGLGAAATHYAGMVGIEFPTLIVWDPGRATAAVVIGSTGIAAGFGLYRRAGRRGAVLLPAALVAGGVGLLHLLAMTAITLRHDPRIVVLTTALPRGTLVLAVAGVMAAILGFAALGLVADRLRQANAALTRRGEDLARQTAQFDAALNAMSQGLCLYDTEGRLVVANRRFREIYGLPGDAPPVGLPLAHVLCVIGPAPAERAALAAVHRDPEAGPFQHLSPAGRTVAISRGAMADGGFVVTYEDVTERSRAEAALRASATALQASEERLAFALDGGTDGHWDWNIATGEVWYSDRWLTMLGFAAGELDGSVRTWERLCHPEDWRRTARLLAEHFDGRAPDFTCEQRLRRKDGAFAWVLARGKVVARGATGAPLRMVGTQLDITHRKEAEARFVHMASHDPLTGLPNRLLFQERLAQNLAEADRVGTPFAVFCLDLDGFKAVNDGFGHSAGDALLRVAAERIRATLRGDDLVARLGGDEFAVLIPGPQPRERYARVAERLIGAMREPLILHGEEVVVGVSVGIALAPDHGTDGDDLVRRADLALYRAKAEGRNTYRFADAAEGTRPLRRAAAR